MVLQSVSLKNGFFAGKIPIEQNALDELKHSDIYPDGTKQPYVHFRGNLAVLPLNEKMTAERATKLLRGHAMRLYRENLVLRTIASYRNYWESYWGSCWEGATHEETKKYFYEALERLHLSMDDVTKDCQALYLVKRELLVMMKERTD
jgi:hypothetical protein